MSQRLVQSSLANLFVSHEVCLWNVSIQGDSVYSCNPLDDGETTAFPSEEDESMREWRQEFPEKMRRAIIRIHTNLGHPQNSTLRVLCASECPGPVSDVLCQFQERDSSMTLCWLMCISGIFKAVRFWCTQ